MAVRLIKKSWWVDFRANHTRYRKRSPENTRAGAQVYEAALRQKLARGESVDKAAVGEDVTFGRFAQKWFDEYVVPNNKPSEQKTKRYILRSSLVPFFGKALIAKITTHHIEQYKGLALKEGAARKTINNRLTVFRKCMATAYDWLEFPGTPPKVVWLKCPSRTMDYLSPDECDLLLANATGVIREMILMALRTGMRQGELKGLQWSSIDW